jgi:integrase
VTGSFYKREGSHYVYLSVYCADGRIKKSTGIEIPPGCFKDGNVVNGKRSREAATNISLFENIRMRVNNHITECLIKDKPVLKVDIRRILNKPKDVAAVHATQTVVVRSIRPSEKNKLEADQTSFFLEYQRMISAAESGELLTPDDTVYTRDTLKVWKTNKRLLEEFSKERGMSVEPDDLTMGTVKAFSVWMNGRNYALNYVGIHNRHWKYIVRLMHEKKLHSNIIWTDKKWKAKFEVVDYPFLTDDEVKMIWQYECPNKEQEHARDRWVLEYCTGLRVKDSLRLSMQHFGERNITIVNNKTGKGVVIPYHPIMEELLEKYGGNLPPKQSEQKSNENMKDVAKAAGITDMYTYSKTVGGKLQHITRPRYELVTNHTARRSMVSNMIANGISHDQGGDIVGMTQATWSRYNKNSKAAKAMMVQNNPMFKLSTSLRKVS